MKRSRYLLAAFLAAILAHLPVAAQACSVCMGNASSKTAGAMNGAIFLMLGFVALMLTSVGGFILYLLRRASAPLPPYAEVGQMPNPSEEQK